MNRNVIASIIVAIVAIGVFIFILPVFKDINLARAAKLERQVALEKRKIDVDNFINLKKQFDTKQDDIARIKAFLPAKRQIDEIVTTIKKVSDESGLQMADFSVYDVDSSTSGGAPRDYREVQISTRITGDFIAFTNFIKSLEQSLRLYDVQDVQISVPNDSSGTSTNNQTNFLVKISTYFVK